LGGKANTYPAVRISGAGSTLSFLLALIKLIGRADEDKPAHGELKP
jgi:hypothetical protein